MAIYYVRPDGSNTNAGTGPGAGQAWATVAFALGAASGTNPGLVGGDTVYIAPGTYRNTVTIGYTTPTSMITVQGDPSCSQFSGLTAGPIRITNAPVGDTAPTRAQFFSGTTDYLTLRNIQFDGLSAYSTGLVTLTGGNLTIDKCVFQTYTDSGNGLGAVITIAAGKNNITFSNCIFFTYSHCIQITLATQGSSNYNTNTQINNCFIYSQTSYALQWANTTASQFSGLSVKDSTIIGYNNAIQTGNSNAGTGNTALNCILNGITGRGFFQWNAGSMTATNCSIIGATSTSGVTLVNCNTLMQLYDLGQTRLWGIGQVETFSPQQGSVMLNAGTTGGIATDLMGVTWLAPSTPTLGTLERSSTSTVGFYIPAERNASTITIAPGSTSQSIELYLGATGLTFATSGLSAYFVRNREAPTPITLVTQTATGTWASGGFAEISSTFTPGLYRLDIPNAAVAAGADDVTVVVRGASGTNGAVMTIKLSSGGLTAAQTAQAVLDATASTHNNIGSIGASIQDKAGYSLSTPQSFSTTGSVGSVTGNVAGNVTGTVGGVAGNVTGNIAGSVATVASPDNIIDGVWDEQRTGHTASGSFGEKLQTNALADEMLARDLGSGLNAGTAEERTVRSALRALRNKVNVGSSQMVVKKEDDTTDAWTASVTTTAVSSNVSGIDPN